MPKGAKFGGRVKGTPNKTTALVRERIASLGDPLAFLAAVMNGEKVKAALLKDGDTALEVVPTLDQRIAASKVLADKACPNARSRPIKIDLPAIKEPADILAAQAAIIAAVSRGEILPDEAKLLADTLETHRRCIETVDLANRIAAIEAQQATTGATR